jgi:hypothetical protein
MVTITCPGGCGDEITVKAEDVKVAECAECYFDRTLPEDYYDEGKAA